MGQESRRERKKQEMRRRILDCALLRFSQGGFEATSLQAIADEADVSIPTLRNHFGSKDGLLVAILEQFVDLVEEGVREIVERGLTDAEAMIQQALAINRTVRELPPDLVAHMMRVAAAEHGVASVMDDLQKALARVIAYAQAEAGGRRDVDATRLAQMIADLMLGGLVDWARAPEIDSQAHTEIVFRAAVDLVIPSRARRAATPAESSVEVSLAAPKPTTQPTRSGLRRQILEVARRRFAEDGVRETTLEAIADELSISQLTILHHFGSKDGLLAQLALAFAEGIEDNVREALAGGLATDLPTAIAIIPSRLAELPSFGSRLTGEVLRVMLTHPDGMVASRRINRAMAELVAEGQRRGLIRTDLGPLLLARILLDLSYASVLRWVRDPSPAVTQAQEDAMRAARLFLDPSPPEA